MNKTLSSVSKKGSEGRLTHLEGFGDKERIENLGNTIAELSEKILGQPRGVAAPYHLDNEVLEKERLRVCFGSSKGKKEYFTQTFP